MYNALGNRFGIIWGTWNWQHFLVYSFGVWTRLDCVWMEESKPRKPLLKVMTISSEGERNVANKPPFIHILLRLWISVWFCGCNDFRGIIIVRIILSRYVTKDSHDYSNCSVFEVSGCYSDPPGIRREMNQYRWAKSAELNKAARETANEQTQFCSSVAEQSCQVTKKAFPVKTIEASSGNRDIR
jgi:hypothetical protein